MTRLTWLVLAALPALLPAQEPVAVRVNAAEAIGPFRPIWAWFGYDEPNYTYAENGRKLISELAALSPVPVHIRTHNLLTSGDGTPALKWGSTNAYTQDADGRPVYNWTILDRIFDTWVREKIKPLVEIGFMPEALSTKAQPYRHDWPRTPLAAGWAYPPKDYRKWADLVREWARHAVARYGRAEVESWYWEVWNEPDIEYWQGTPEEYDKLYDLATDALKSVSPAIRCGGPATTGPAGANGARFLRQFLEHCDHTGVPLDFITYHAKGRTDIVDGHVRMGLAKNLEDVARGLEIVTSFPRFRDLPIILSESDPEGCGACSAQSFPQKAYRNGPLYASYQAAAMKGVLDLAKRYKANIEGMLTWAFEFEDQPYFAGFRTLATNGIDKPVLNFFRMAGLMSGERVAVDGKAALATRSAREVSVLLWNYNDDDVEAPDAPIRLKIVGLPAGASRVQVRHYRIDRDHSNACTAWKQMGSPQNPTLDQTARLEAAGQLQLLDSPRWLTSESGQVELSFALPRQAVSLVQVSW
ncbi:MAG: beta-xylosidase [Bryobacteraceae bacterium]|jgi:xylan 1,4-beta-xylosidase